MQRDEFDSFFKPYSKNVDSADELHFWKLSDRIIYEVIKRHIPLRALTEKEVVLDAGGGTGRWIAKMAQETSARFILYDLSSDMLAKARENLSAANIQERVNLVEGDLSAMDKLQENSVDHIVSIYSPLSFVTDPQKVVNELYRVIRPGGKVLLMGHGFYNALYSKIMNYQAPPEELLSIDETETVKWAPYVPTLSLFSKERMEELLVKAGFNPLETYGIPAFAQPGMEDFDQSNKEKSSISRALENQDFFDRVLALELSYSNLPTVANRGVNIFSVGEK
ncbi:MAG TPA: class I SAM-dependent methyltransferase [Candidatus Paceibacterota bacterium]